MFPRPVLVLSGLLTAGLTFSSSAAADPLTAEALFREGRRLLEEGRIDEACVKLAESHVQDPASGTLINLARCYEKQGKLATAWATYLAAAASARKDGRADRVLSAEQKGSELEPHVPRLVFRAAQPVADLVIAWGAARVGAGALGSAIPVDPGSYRIEVSANGFDSWVETVTVADGESKVVEIPALHQKPIVEQTPVLPSRPRAQHSPAAPPPSIPPIHESSRILPIALGAAGIAALGTGTYFGFRSLSEYAEAKRLCPTHRDCAANAMDSWRHAKTSAWVANVGIPLGAVALAASGWLFWKRKADRPRVGVSVVPAGKAASIELGLDL
jgi:tetratricopeptide (TPR) repeat protein